MREIVTDLTLLALYCGMIFWLSDHPRIPTPFLFHLQDKILHATAYAVMSWLAWRLFRHLIPQANRLILVSIAFCSLYGVTDEFHQSFVPGRTPDVGDWLADTLGATIAMFFVTIDKHYINKLIKKFCNHSAN